MKRGDGGEGGGGGGGRGREGRGRRGKGKRGEGEGGDGREWGVTLARPPIYNTSRHPKRELFLTGRKFLIENYLFTVLIS
jgi:hypothetical protein